MLTELKVSQFAIIDNLHISFDSGLNIISGETGAGKSIILKCLSMLMGQKTSTSIIQQGKSKATIVGAFDLSERTDIIEKLLDMGIETSDEQLIVRRVLNNEGKSKVYLNDNLSALSTLKQVVAPLIEFTNQDAPLIEMTAQHDNRNLQSTNYHLDILDSYVGAWDERTKYESEFLKLKKIQNEISELEGKQPDHVQRLDFLKFQYKEIENLNLKPGEETQLETKIKTLKSSSNLTDYINQVENTLYSSDKSCLVVLHNLLQNANEFKAISPELIKKVAPLSQAKTIIEECLYDLRDFSANINTDIHELESYESTLNSLRKLQRKYGQSVDEILSHKQNIEEEIYNIENFDLRIEELKKEYDNQVSVLSKLASRLHKKRTNGAKLFSDSINIELSDLNMKGVIFLVDSSELEGLGPHGNTAIEFLIKQNKKDLPRPIAKVASGGELSRILLSLKRVVGSTEVPRTFLFDEVDTGVSGPTAEKVGKKLKEISKGQQVICVTHLPQVAAFSDHHYLIEKNNTKSKTTLNMKKLAKTEKVNEIARLISGEKITKTSLAHAKELLSN